MTDFDIWYRNKVTVKTYNLFTIILSSCSKY